MGRGIHKHILADAEIVKRGVHLGQIGGAHLDGGYCFNLLVEGVQGFLLQVAWQRHIVPSLGAQYPAILVHCLLVVNVVLAVVDRGNGQALFGGLALLVGELGPQRQQGGDDFIPAPGLGVVQQVFPEGDPLVAGIGEVRQIVQIHPVRLVPHPEIAAQSIQEPGVEDVPGGLVGHVAPVNIVVGVGNRDVADFKLFGFLHLLIVLLDEVREEFRHAAGHFKGPHPAVQQESQLPLAGVVQLPIKALFTGKGPPSEENSPVFFDFDDGF